MKFIKTVVLTLLVSSIGFAQEIQWASELVFQYNNFDSAMYSGKQILGPPDAKMGRLDKNAFRINKDKGYGVVTVAYNNPHPVSQILIVENNVPGRLAKLVLYDTLNNEHVLYEPNAKIINISSRILNLKIEKTTFAVSKISAHLNTINYPGWAQIDAIGICEEIVDDKKISEITGDEELIFEERIMFAGRKEKMTGSINSSYAEAKPLLSPDGKTLYFVRQNAPENTGGVDDDQDIYYSDFINNRWTLAQNIGEPLNDLYPNGICSISADGNTIWVINGYNSDDSVEDGISVSTKTGNGWSKPKKLDIIGFNNVNQYQDYFVSNSSDVILMAIESEDSYGDQDLYVSFKLDLDIWSLPLNLGKTINTPDVEYAPFLAADNRTLYFSSNGHDDPAQSDVYYCRRLDDSWLKWSRPKPVGPEINTGGWDGYFTLSTNSDFAYFVSTEGFTTSVSVKDINNDIYRIPINKEPEPEQENSIIVTGKVLNDNTNEFIKAGISFTGLKNQQYSKYASSTEKDGKYSIKLTKGEKYKVLAEAPDFISFSQEIDFSDVNTPREITKDLILSPIVAGLSIRLENLFFLQGESQILPESVPELERLYDVMTENPSLVIELGGHTDNRGSANANILLSQQRANAVYKYLLNRGINKNRISAKGYGSKQPVASNADAESRQLNRRVEIKVIKY